LQLRGRKPRYFTSYTPAVTSHTHKIFEQGCGVGEVISHTSTQGLVMEGEDRTRVLQLGFQPKIARSVPATDQTKHRQMAAALSAPTKGLIILHSSPGISKIFTRYLKTTNNWLNV